MDKKQDKNKENGLNLLLILFSTFIIYVSYMISGNKLTISSPGAFPLFISIMMLIFSIWIYLEKLTKYKETKNEEYPTISEVINQDVILLIIFLIIYGIILSSLGFALSTLAFLWASMSFLSKDKYIKNLGISLIVVTVIMIIFSTVFKVILP